MATCSYRCGKDLDAPVKTEGATRYYVCKACGHRVSTIGEGTGSVTWSSHGHEPYPFEGSKDDAYDFGLDDFDFGF